jgi:hypothetical protein
MKREIKKMEMMKRDMTMMRMAKKKLMKISAETSKGKRSGKRKILIKMKSTKSIKPFGFKDNKANSINIQIKSLQFERHSLNFSIIITKKI